MEKEHCLLDTIFDEGDDVEMVDVEEGEFVEDAGADVLRDEASSCAGDTENKNSNDCGKRNKKKKRRKKRSGGGSGGCNASSVPDVNRFVLDICRRLREKKSYMVYNAVACLGTSALSNILKEVEAVQSCGGQMTTDGRRFRTGGGVLWNILKSREPDAYKEIMKRTKEFEKQFKHLNRERGFQKSAKPAPSTTNVSETADTLQNTAGDPETESKLDDAPDTCQGKRTSIHDRLRIPVSYTDLLTNDTNGAVPP